MAGSRKGCLPWVVGWLVVAGAGVGWLEFLVKPLRERPPRGGVGQVLSDLLRFVPDTYGWPLAGYVFLATSLLLALAGIILVMRPIRMLLNYLEVSEAPVSVLRSDITLHLEDELLTRCTTTRRQHFHANRDDVQAYHYSESSVDGRIDAQAISVKSWIGDELITKETIKHAAGKSVETIEIFTRTLPRSLLATYLPSGIVFALAESFFKKVVVNRIVTTAEEDEYNGGWPMFQVTAVRYPASNVSITISFPSKTAPLDTEIHAYLITTNAVQTLRVESRSEGGRCVYRAKVSSLKKEQSFRIQWVNTKLEQYKNSQG